MRFHDLDLAERLAVARRGTGYFARHLAELADAELAEPSLLDGWTRRHLVAHVGFNATALCSLMEWAETGVEKPMYPSAEHRAREIEHGAQFSSAELRNHFERTAARLDEKWRAASAPVWQAQVRTAQGRRVPAEETTWMRTREVWIHAVDLASGARFSDFPQLVLSTLLEEIAGLWRTRGEGTGIVLEADGRRTEVAPGAVAERRVQGSLGAVVQWAAGRGADGLDRDPGAPPRWL